ncbi:MAG: iron-sulfur cluster insertion protein ErpA [Acidimicrobiia bacterium]|nr:iron-sulfur cluster insertion protein ErpA [Acidimicrobiia bacterium]
MNLTDSAAEKLQELMLAEGEGVQALRVAVNPGGCSGFTYEMYFDSEIADDDIVRERNGVKLVVDPASAQHVAGATLDFKDGGLNGAGFAIDNPNVSRTCGCGNSFS